MLIQFVASIVIAIIIYSLIQKFRNDKLSRYVFLGWLLFWLIALVIFWIPEITSYLASILGIGRGADLIIYISVVVIFYLIFKIYLYLNKLESQITKVVRHFAINETKQNNDASKSSNNHS
jgi:small membrane protein